MMKMRTNFCLSLTAFLAYLRVPVTNSRFEEYRGLRVPRSGESLASRFEVSGTMVFINRGYFERTKRVDKLAASGTRGAVQLRLRHFH